MQLIQKKREAFHNEIRSRNRQEYFAAQRKLLFQAQYTNMRNMNSNQGNSNDTVINSMQELQKHMADSYVPDYFAINEFLNAPNNLNQPLSEKILSSLMQLSLQSHFLKNEHALVLLVKLFNLKQFDSYYWLNEQRVTFYVDRVIKQNLVLQDPQHTVWRVDYFTSVCWFLYVLAHLSSDKQFMMPIIQHMQVLQSQAYQQSIPQQFICLLSQLSTHPQLLPSHQFIQYLLTQQTAPTQDMNYLIPFINLLDNFLRYKCQPNRFQTQQAFQLAMNYFRFINKKINQFKFPHKLKIDLINLLNSIIKSAQDQLLIELFNLPESKQLCEQLFYRSLYSQWQEKSVSFNCFSFIFTHQLLLPKVSEYIDPSRIVHLYIHSLTFPDRQFQTIALACINSLLIMMPQMYKPYFRDSYFKDAIKHLQISDQKYQNQHGEQGYINLSAIANQLYSKVFQIKEQ